MLFATWTHHHMCIFEQFYSKRRHPDYVPLFIPTRLPNSVASTLQGKSVKGTSTLVSVLGAVNPLAWPDFAPKDHNDVLPVHSTRHGKNSQWSPIFIATLRFNPGDVVAYIDPHWPIPKWLPKALDGLSTIPGNNHENCIIRPNTTIRESMNSFMTCPSRGPYIPCADVHEVANTVLTVHNLLTWECKSDSHLLPIMLPHVTIVAKSTIFAGQSIILEHSTCTGVAVARNESQCSSSNAKPRLPKVKIRVL